MKKMLILGCLITLISGCAHTSYRLIVYNGSREKIEDIKIVFGSGKSFNFGGLYSNIKAGMYPMEGPLGNKATLEWVDSNGCRKSNTVSIVPRLRDDSIIFLINSSNTVEVQTGRKLYGPRK